MWGHDPREPPVASPTLPFIGHLIGLSRSSYNYHVELSKQNPGPIFTMYLPGQKYYVITKPELIQQAQKLYKTLAFPPIEAKFTHIVCGSSPEARAIIDHNVNGEDGDHGMSMETYAAMRKALLPGPAFDALNRAMIEGIAGRLDLLQPAEGTRSVKLYGWLREAITLAITRAVYGPMNPYDDKEVADAFWEFEAGLMSILVGILPSITARKPVAARTKVAKAFEAYYRAGGTDKASAYAQNRYQVGIANDIPLEDIARFEVGGSIAILLNTVPASLWTLLHFHAHPGLLDEIRAEIDACTLTDTTENNVTLKTIDVASLKRQCPLLMSSFQEVLRFRAVGASTREVMEDVCLDGYLLKKGAMIQMPSRVIHEDNEIWGDTSFAPRRFHAGEVDKKKTRDVCFRAFGGGKTLCPGRHFAINEVLAFVATFVARLDMQPAEGEWKLPTTANTNVASAIMEPDYDVEVEITTRQGFAGVKWAVRLDDSDVNFAMATEDKATAQD